MIENQVVASFLAQHFFKALETEKSLKFLDVGLIHIVDEGLYFSIEDFIEGSFQKWINNAGAINEDIYSCTLGKLFNYFVFYLLWEKHLTDKFETYKIDAFSHWTYQATEEYLIVNDLQGMIVDNKEYILTDPALTSPEGFDRFSNTNLGIKGIEKFFTSHQCNHFCKHLELAKHKYQKKPDRAYNPMMTRIR